MQIVVPDALIEDAERQWAPPSDPVFKLVPTTCEEHISLVYAQLGSPEVCFDSFWNVYNQLRDAVDPELLFQSSTNTFDEEDASEKSCEDPDVDQLPLRHLRACEFGKDGIPAGQTIEGE